MSSQCNVVGMDVRVAGQHPVTEPGHLRRQFGARVAGSDDDEGERGTALLLVVHGVRGLELGQDAVTEIERLGVGLESDGVFGEAGDVEQARHAAHGEQQPVVGKVVAVAVRVGVAHGSGIRIDVSGAAAKDVDPGEPGGRGHGDGAWIEGTDRHVGQQRRVQHPVAVREQDDVRTGAA
jgi:hypothetical protein